MSRRILAAALALTAASVLATFAVSRPNDPTPPAAGAPFAAGDAPLVARFEVRPIDPFVRTVDGSTTTFDRELRIEGEGFFGTSHGPYVDFDGARAWGVRIESERLITVVVPASLRGSVAVRVTNPDGRTAADRVDL